MFFTFVLPDTTMQHLITFCAVSSRGSVLHAMKQVENHILW